MQVDVGDYDGRTALHVAACGGNVKMLRMLIEQYSANHYARDRTGCSPLDDAFRHRHFQAVHYLAHLNTTQVFSSERYVAHTNQAAADDDIEYVKIVIEAGMDPNCMDHNHRTPLHLAASNSSMKVLQYLVDTPGVELGPVDKMGHTPVWDAILNGDRKAVALLRSKGAAVQPDLSVTLCGAAARNEARLFEMLLAHNIDILSKVCISLRTRVWPSHPALARLRQQGHASRSTYRVKGRGIVHISVWVSQDLTLPAAGSIWPHCSSCGSH